MLCVTAKKKVDTPVSNIREDSCQYILILNFFLMRYNSHSINSIFKACNSVVLVCSQDCVKITTIWFQNIFITLKRTLCLLQTLLFSFLNPWQPHIPSFMSPWICLCWAFDVSGMRQYMVFCAWLLSLSTVFSGSLHFVAWMIFLESVLIFKDLSDS